MKFFKTRNLTSNQEVGKSQNQEPEPGTLFLVGSWFLAGRFGFGLPLTEMLESKMEAFKQATKKEGRIMGPVSPTVTDVVLIKSDVRTDYSRFGIVVELKSPTTLMIQTRYANGKKLEERPVSKLSQ